MERTTIGITTLIFLLLLPLAVFAADFGNGRLSLIQGDVQIRTGDDGEWVPASINIPVSEGDSVWCPDGGRVEITFRDGTTVRLDARTSLDFLDLSDTVIHLHQGMGRMYTKTGKRAAGRDISIDLPTTTVRIEDSVRLRTDISDEGDEEISLIKGAVSIESGDSQTELRTGEMLVISDAGAEILPLKTADAWEKWNRERDRKTARRLSARYVPDELAGWSSDLDNSGEWVYESDYGYVWRPTIVVADWSPYRIGRWCWMGGDYVWISAEPWGWVPYHYGRWAFLSRRGWCWVPPHRGEVHWGPGYVGWVVTGSYVGWVPLAPGEVYYGYGNYGPRSVNVTTNVVVTNVVYRNASLPHAVTTVNRNSFLAGRHDVVSVKDNLFTRRDGVSGPPPRIVSSRPGFRPSDKQIPPSKLPPPRVRDFNPRESKLRGGMANPPGRPSGEDHRRPGASKPQAPQQPVRVRQEGQGSPDRRVVLPQRRGSDHLRPTEQKSKPAVPSSQAPRVSPQKTPSGQRPPEAGRPSRQPAAPLPKPAQQPRASGDQRPSPASPAPPSAGRDQRPGGVPPSTVREQRPGGSPPSTVREQRPGGSPSSTVREQRPGGVPPSTVREQRPGGSPPSTVREQRPGAVQQQKVGQEVIPRSGGLPAPRPETPQRESGSDRNPRPQDLAPPAPRGAERPQPEKIQQKQQENRFEQKI